jgi:nitroimidazol reductase NimA-like FMN-containing flavoprotein (pyridoxamine 5'-phosphate oxidase superfamily)
MADEPNRLAVIGEDECWELLRSVPVGRLAMDSPDGLLIIPVNFVVADKSLVFRTAEGGLLSGAADWGRAVAFQADRIEEAIRWGWSVLVQGQLRRVSDDEAQHLLTSVAPWAGGERHVVGRIAADRISGRRIGDAT